MTNRVHIFERVTEQVLAAMDRDGVAPWQRPWVASGEMPHNAVSRKPYRGANVLILALAAMGRGYRSPKWLTFSQARALGGSVKKGEKGTHIIFWKPFIKKDKKTGEEKKSVIAREYVVFNVEQCEGLELPATREPTKADAVNEEAERIIGASPCAITYGGDQAFYRPTTDTITLPPRRCFKSHSLFYTTAFHEMGHASGHPTRLDRDGISKFDGFGSHQYSREELVAEFTACFLAGHCGFERATLDNSAAYLKTWAAKLRDEKTLIAEACQAAQRAADYILDASECDEDGEAEAA